MNIARVGFERTIHDHGDELVVGVRPDDGGVGLGRGVDRGVLVQARLVRPTPPPLVPRDAVRFGFLSLAPLVVSGLMCLSHDPMAAHVGAVAFAIYAAALLSFLGGVRCGFEIMRAPQAPDARRLLFSAAPALVGWIFALALAVLPVPPGTARSSLACSRCNSCGMRAAPMLKAPAWYPVLRQVLTGGVMIICLLLPFADVLRRL